MPRLGNRFKTVLVFSKRKDGIQVQERKKARSKGTQIKGSLTNAATVHYTN